MLGALPCEAIILRYTNYGDADRIVTLLTLEHGVCSAMARNARNSRRRFGGSLQPFNRVRVLWQRRRHGGLPQLAEVELLAAVPEVMANLEALALAAYACDLVTALVPQEQSVPEIYLLLVAFFAYLPSAASCVGARLLFELRLLELLGLLPHLGHCAQCWEPLGDEWLLFDAARGGSLCRRCAADNNGVVVQAMTMGSLARLVRVDYERFGAISLSGQTLTQGRAVVKQILSGCVARKLKSEQFLDQVTGMDARVGGGILP